MSVSDRRRLLGPANAIIPNVDISLDSNLEESNSSKANDEIRKFFLKKGLVENANGSAYLEIGNTIIEVSVFGPRPIRGSFVERGSFSVECKFLPYIHQPNEVVFNGTQNNFNNNNNGRPGLTNIEQKISSYIETSLLSTLILEKYPKSTIDLFITIVSTDSNIALLNLLNWVLNCSSLALVDSGIEIRDIVTSGQVRYDLSKEELTLDSVNSSESKDSVDCIVSFMNLRNDEIVGLWIEGNQNLLHEKNLDKLIQSCNEMSKTIRNNINSFLLNSTN